LVVTGSVIDACAVTAMSAGRLIRVVVEDCVGEMDIEGTVAGPVTEGETVRAGIEGPLAVPSLVPVPSIVEEAIGAVIEGRTVTQAPTGACAGLSDRLSPA